MIRRALSVTAVALVLAGCDAVLERERFGVREKQTPNAVIPPGSVPRGQGEFLAESQAPGPKLDLALLQRGRERYNIYCTPCHGPDGHGRGPVVQRGFPPAATFHSERLRAAPLVHFVNVVTHGLGAMPSYAERIPPHDRWAIAGFIKALQLSERFPADQLSSRLEGGAQ